MVEKLGSFTQVKFVTSDGEKCVATKNNGIVTIHGNKKGVRQLPINVFMQELIADQQKISLEKSPKQDTVSFSGGNKDMKFGPGGFGPGHPNYTEDSKNKGLIFALGALVVGGVIYALTKGKAKLKGLPAINTIKGALPSPKTGTQVARGTVEVISSGKAKKPVMTMFNKAKAVDVAFEEVITNCAA